MGIISTRRFRKEIEAGGSGDAAGSLPQTPWRGVTPRAIAIAVPLVAVNCYWVLETEGIWHSNHATAMSLFWNTTFFLFVLVVLNVFVLRRFAPRHALNQGELIAIYVFMTLGSALAGHDPLQLGITAFSGGRFIRRAMPAL